MPNNELKAVVTADIKQFTNAMSAVGLSASSAATAAIAAFAAIIASVVALEKVTLGAAKSYETLETRLKLLAGDLGKGAEEFKKIKKFAEESAFSTEEVIGAYIKLRAVAGVGFATKHIEDVAFASAVAGENMETMASRVGELVLRIKSGLSGGLLAKSLRTFGTAFGEEATLDLVKMAQAGEDSQVILAKVAEALGRLGESGKVEFGKTAEGLEKRLGGVITGGLAELGGAENLETYKLILKEIIDLFSDLASTDVGKNLKESLGEFLATVLELIKSDGFKQFLIDAISFIKLLVDAVTILVKGLHAILYLTGKLPSGYRNPLGSASHLVAGAANDRSLTLGSNIAQMETARKEREMAELKKNTKANEKTAKAY